VQKEPEQGQKSTQVYRQKQAPDRNYVVLVRLLLKKPEFYLDVLDEEWEEFIPEDLRIFLHKFKDYANTSKTPNSSDWIYCAKETGMDWVEEMVGDNLLNSSSGETNNIEKELKGCLIRFKLSYLERKRLENLLKLKEDGNSESAMREYMAIVEQINQLKPKLGLLD